MGTAIRTARLTLCCFWAVACGGLAEESALEGPDAMRAGRLAGKADGLGAGGAAAWTEGDPVRLAMRDVRSDLPSSAYWSLLRDGAVREAPAAGGDLSGFLREGLLLGLERRRTQGSDADVEIRRYRVDADVEPVALNEAHRTTPLGFGLAGGGAVEFAAVRGHGPGVGGLTLMDVPHDADSALALPGGVVASMPLRGRLAVDVGGRFLTRAARLGEPLTPHLSVSAVGAASGVRQGTLLIDGRLLVQVIRLEGSRVRLRVVTGAQLEASAGVGASAMGMAGYRFLPSAVLDRARAIRRRVGREHARLRNVRRLRERIGSLRGALAPELDRLLEAGGAPEGDEALAGVREAAARVGDAAFGVADAAGSLEALDDAVLGRVDAALGAATGAWDSRVDPVLERVRRLSSRVYDLAGEVRLSDRFARTLRTVADYEFDLSDELARRAFDRAISGRSAWIDAWTSAGADAGAPPLSDLTLAETLAVEDADAQRRRVVRHASSLGELRRRSFAVRASGLGMGTDLRTGSTDRTLELIDGDGMRSSFEARAWEHERSVRWVGDRESTRFASGAFVQSGFEDLQGGAYWFSWRRAYPEAAWRATSEALSEALNLLGPAAVRAGVPALYDGEHDGRINASLDVAFTEPALEALFDADRTPDVVLWETFADVADTFDNRFGLPYLLAPFRPRVLDEIPDGHALCDRIGAAFGAWYCGYFASRVVPRLREAQSAADPAARLEFFERFYEAGFFANPVGARLFVRFVAQLTERLGAGDGVSLNLSIRNDRDGSEAASPGLTVGDPAVLTLIRSVGG